jgi:multimeric flavodoxin WrbA/ADP-ribose pyrophosphatase YjhB (NUDIX family)
MIVVVNFSSRKDGNCYQISGVVKKHYKEKKVKIFNFYENTYNSCGHCDYECFKKKCKIGDGINEIFKAIVQSEETVFVVPNYCDYPNSNFFLFNERSCGFFNGNKDLMNRYLNIPKKFIVVSNSCNNSFKTAFSYHLSSDETPNILYFNSKKFDQNPLDGKLMSNKEAEHLVYDFLSNRYEFEESAMAIVFYKQKVLATVEEVYDRPTLSLPKGHIEPGETKLDAAIRECFEETNEIITKDNFIGDLKPFDITFISHQNKLIKKTIYPLIFRVDKMGNLKAKEERIRKVKYLNIGEFLLKCTYENVKTMIMEATCK